MSLEVVEQKLKDHIDKTNTGFEFIGKSIDNLKIDFKNMKDNHLSHIQKDVTDLKIGMNGVKTDVSWLKRFFWIIATASVGALLAGIINIIINVNS